VLIQLLLPVTSAPTNHAAIAQTRADLIQRYQGVTAYVRSPAKGAWVGPDGTEQHDDVIMVEVLTETFDREEWRAYARELAARFGEEEIHIRALPAFVP
jgi:hypothetical protein